LSVWRSSPAIGSGVVRAAARNWTPSIRQMTIGGIGVERAGDCAVADANLPAQNIRNPQGKV